MLVFDKNRKRCVAPPTEDCDVPATTPPSEEEQQDNNSGLGNSGPRGGRPQQSPENRRRFQTNPQQLDSRDQLPFNLPEGATLLQRPPQ
jgi:hypothetical protein